MYLIGVEPNDEMGMQKMIGVQYFRIADTYMTIEEYKRAFEVYEKLSQISASVPTIESSTIWMRQARCAYLLHDFPTALDFYRKGSHLLAILILQFCKWIQPILQQVLILWTYLCKRIN